MSSVCCVFHLEGGNNPGTAENPGPHAPPPQRCLHEASPAGSAAFPPFRNNRGAGSEQCTFPLPESATQGEGGCTGMLCVIISRMKRSVSCFCCCLYVSHLCLSTPINAYQYCKSLWLLMLPRDCRIFIGPLLD